MFHNVFRVRAKLLVLKIHNTLIFHRLIVDLRGLLSLVESQLTTFWQPVVTQLHRRTAHMLTRPRDAIIFRFLPKTLLKILIKKTYTRRLVAWNTVIYNYSSKHVIKISTARTLQNNSTNNRFPRHCGSIITQLKKKNNKQSQLKPQVACCTTLFLWPFHRRVTSRQNIWQEFSVTGTPYVLNAIRISQARTQSLSQVSYFLCSIRSKHILCNKVKRHSEWYVSVICSVIRCVFNDNCDHSVHFVGKRGFYFIFISSYIVFGRVGMFEVF